MIKQPKFHSAIFDNAEASMIHDGVAGSDQPDVLRLAICLPEFSPLQQAMSGYPADAAYIQQAYIVLGLQKLGHQLTFVSPYELDNTICTTEIQDGKLAPKSWSGRGWFRIITKGTWKVQQWLKIPYLNVFSNYTHLDSCLRCLPGHDLVYERNGLYNNSVAKACQRLNLPYVMFFDADQILELEYEGMPLTGLLLIRAQRLLQFNLAAADYIICVSEPSRDHLANNWGVPKEKTLLFPNGVDVEKFRPDLETQLQTRASLGLDDQPLIVFVGSFYKWHDVATLLDAFAKVLEQQPDVHLLLVGDGARRVAMEQYAAELNVDHAVHFTGLVAHTEVPQLLAAADIAVAPYPAMDSDLWLSPLKLFEYMASGLAVIASNVGQLAEVITGGKNGLLVAPGDSSDLANGINRLINDPAFRSGLGRQAREDAVNKHSWDHYLSRLERLFAAIVKGQPYENL